MSTPTDASALAQLATRLGLVTEDQLRDAWMDLESRNASAEAMLRVLERKAYLTPWQGSKLLKGDTDGYFLGGYRLLYKIAAGTFGRVFRADDPRSGEVVAVKVLRRRWSENSQKIDLFEREGKMGLALRHPNIVSILAVNRDAKSGQYYIVMEFVEGGNLRELLTIRKKMDPKEALKILEETATGLAYAFSRGMTHRDVKPTNILISTQGIAKLVDFGLAEITGPMGEDDDAEVDQSVDYAGLEQATGCKSGDIRSDIYFLGCTFYQMLTGEPLLTITKDMRARKLRTRFDVADQIRRADLGLPPLIVSLICRMVSLDPTDRYQTPSQLLEAIRNVRREIEGGARIAGAQPTGPRTVYVVESSPRLQDIFRERLKEHGYRVLISIDASRALQRYQQQPYHALVVDIETAGPEALEPFEKVMRESQSMGVTCAGILIFAEDQADLVEKITPAPYISTMVRPVTMKQLTNKLDQLLPAENKEPQTATG